jgi:hypothetical protein
MTHGAVYPLMESCMKGIVMNVALREPYVMNSILALSAHHLSSLRPHQHSFYHNLAMQLQTQALSLFNSIDVGLFGDSVEKRVPVFVFSSVLGIHALCDVLSHRDPDAESAIDRFMSYLSLHRGMHTVMHGYWEQLRTTELKVIFDELVPQFYQMTSEGQECDDILEKLKSADLDAEELQWAEHAAGLVQCVFDAKPKQESRAYVLCSWVAMLNRSFVRMLEARRPEALAILAYYFLAMHYCREVWMMKGAGKHFLTLLADHFRGGEWYAWVEPPYQMLQDSLEREAAAAANNESQMDDGGLSQSGPSNHPEQ